MFKNCEECGREFDSNKTEPTLVGYGREINQEYVRRRPHSNLCEHCLMQQIAEEQQSRAELLKNTAPQD